ncbi:MAG: vanadium-dependent haloperoxidase [Acidimicrobiia bacterium]|nr:vanadium-dependent haloperoxidase [Acidimicrobiia bacterium]
MLSHRPLRLLAVGAVLGVTSMLLVSFTLGRGGEEEAACVPVSEHPEWSVARRWNEAALDAIRRDVPMPTVHARNLFHLATAMWDAWAAYSPEASGYFVHEKHTAPDVAAARSEAISYAAYRLLEHRYLNSVGASDSIPEFDALMAALCYPTEVTATEGDGPAALGNRIAAEIIAFGLTDRSNEAGGYQPTGYRPVNEPLVVKHSGAVMADPNRWQPLEIDNMVTQNGIPLASGPQEAIGTHWGYVAAFALPEGTEDGLPVDPGDPPRLGDPLTEAEFKDSAVEVIRLSSLLDPAAGVMIDISPAGLGANPLGTNGGTGHDLNPATGLPYEPNLVNQADFGRALAEVWADGPDSETPPGHWNVIANTVSDMLAPDLRLGGAGPVVDRLEWDVKLYLALNGATHDSAIAAWGVKGYYDTARPICLIRYLGGRGQSSDPTAPSYDPDGLPLVSGLVEVVTAESSAPGERHAALAGHEGEIAVFAWQGVPEDPETGIGGVGWVPAVDWMPYQLPTFVTPAFPGYVSGHSAFSRAAAEVLAAFTGTEYFPGGLGEWTVAAGSLEFEAGPSADVTLQWATYFDAADQAGLSRLYGGIHIRADDLAGRVIGASVGQAAWAEAQRYFAGGGDAGL